MLKSETFQVALYVHVAAKLKKMSLEILWTIFHRERCDLNKFKFPSN